MVHTNSKEQQLVSVQNGQNKGDYDRANELKAFDDTKAGVKGLVDAGIVSIPEFFVAPPSENEHHNYTAEIPVIDLMDINDDFQRKKIVKEVGEASETWGFFQVVNHGVPQHVMDEMIHGVQRFFEQPNELKIPFYSRYDQRKVKYISNFHLYTAPAADWRDTLVCVMAPNPPHSDEIPEACRGALLEYSGHIKMLALTILELLAEALGLKPNHFLDMGCGNEYQIISHYQPACPEPNRTYGIAKHTDPDFFTILLQDKIIGGLQILHKNHWIDIHPMTGALVINIGDFLQILSNDKFKSVEHRVVAKHNGPRISVASYFTNYWESFGKLYGPIKELLTDENPPLYKETTAKDYWQYRIGSPTPLLHLRL